MPPQSPVEAYRQALGVYQDLADSPEFYDQPGYTRQVRAQRSVMQSCVNRLLEVSAFLRLPLSVAFGTIANHCRPYHWLSTAIQARKREK